MEKEKLEKLEYKQAIEVTKLMLRLLNIQKMSIKLYKNISDMSKYEWLSEMDLEHISKLLEELDISMIDSDKLLSQICSGNYDTNKMNKQVVESMKNVLKVAKNV